MTNTNGASLTKQDLDRLDKFQFEVDGFAGVDNSSDSSSLPANVSPDALNTMYDLSNANESRKAYTKLNTTSFPGPIINQTPFYTSAGLKVIVFAANATVAGTAPGGVTGTYLCKYDNAGGYTVIGGPYAINTFWDFTVLNDTLYACNNSNGLQSWVGTGTFTTANAIVLQYIIARKNRLYGAGGNIVYFSDAGNPVSWPSNNYIQINTNDNQVIVGLRTNIDDLVIGKSKSVWYLQGEPLGAGSTTTVGNLQLRQADSEVGWSSTLNVCKVRQGILMWVCESGVAVMQNYSVSIISQKIENTFKNGVNPSFFNKIWGIYSPPEKKYIFGYPSSTSSTCDKAVLVDMGDPKLVKFALWDHFPGSCAALFQFTLRDTVIIGHPTKGYIVEAFQGYADIAGDNGTSSGSNTTSTLKDTTKTWTSNQFADADVTIIAGTGAGQIGNIASNTATALTLSNTWTVTPDTSSVYSIGAYVSYAQTPIEDFGRAAYDKKVKYYNIFSNSHANQTLLFGYATAYQTVQFTDSKSLAGGGLVWEGVSSPDKWGGVGLKWGSKTQLFLQFDVGDVDKHFQAMWGGNMSLSPWRVSKYTVTLKFKKVRPDVV